MNGKGSECISKVSAQLSKKKKGIRINSPFSFEHSLFSVVHHSDLKKKYMGHVSFST